MEVKVWHRGEREKVSMQGDGACGVKKEILVGHRDGSEDIVMRKFFLQKNMETPYHKHDFPHLIYVLEGKGAIKLEDKELPLEEDSSAFVPSNVMHQFVNKGEGKFVFICVVPGHGDPM